MRVLTDGGPASTGLAHREYFAEVRAREFAALDRTGESYLDYTGTALPPRSLVARHLTVLDGPPIGNPHSRNPASALATDLVEQARHAVLAFFGVDDRTHAVVFTANASAAIKLVGEAFPFDAGSTLALLADNHNSVNGLLEYLRPWAGRTVTLPLDAQLRLAAGYPLPEARPGASLLAFPAQSNFSGVRHPLTLVAEARALGYRTLLDAAAFVPTSKLDLSAIPADFTAISFYKMFGYPTGVGALVARRDALAVLRRPWFAGGTVDFVSVQHRLHQLRGGPEGFEDGTPNFLGVAAGLAFLATHGMARIGEWVAGLTGQLLRGLTGLRHPDGSPGSIIHGPVALADRGGTVAFNLLKPDGTALWFESVEAAAGRERIHLRGGCFCNPGAAEAAFGFPAEASRRCLERVGANFSVARLADCLGSERPVGALRASVGVGTSEADVSRLLTFATEAIAAPAAFAPESSR